MKNAIDLYIAKFPKDAQMRLEEIRTIIRKAAPKAEEVLSYGMPAYKMNFVLVYFAGYKSHVGFYPTGEGIKAFEDQLTDYKWSKGAVQFPLDKKFPVKLITAMVKYRLKSDAEKALAKKLHRRRKHLPKRNQQLRRNRIVFLPIKNRGRIDLRPRFSFCLC
jgi:uncharacterized protein YdhG (YjbR/CyaY superfamily)